MTSVKNDLQARSARVVFYLLLIGITASCKKSVQVPASGPEVIVPVSAEGLKILDSAGYDAGFIWERHSTVEGIYTLFSLRNGQFRLKAFHLDVDGRQLSPLMSMDGTWKTIGDQQVQATISDGGQTMSLSLSEDFTTMTLGNGNQYRRVRMTTGTPEKTLESILKVAEVSDTDGIYKNDDPLSVVAVTLTDDRWVCKLELPTGFGSIYDISAASPMVGTRRGNRLFDHSGKVSIGTVTGNLLRFRLAGREVQLERR